MTEGLRKHLPMIVVITIIGVGTGIIALSRVLDAAQGMTTGMFSRLIIVIPCSIMLVCSLLIAMTASEISRQLYLIVVGICVVFGIVSMVVTSGWMSDPTIAEALFVNSGSTDPVVAPLNNPLIIIRDIAAYFVVGTVGCIAGAWIGSRLHPMKSAGKSRKKKK